MPYPSRVVIVVDIGSGEEFEFCDGFLHILMGSLASFFGPFERYSIKEEKGACCELWPARRGVVRAFRDKRWREDADRVW